MLWSCRSPLWVCLVLWVSGTGAGFIGKRMAGAVRGPIARILFPALVWPQASGCVSHPSWEQWGWISALLSWRWTLCWSLLFYSLGMFHRATTECTTNTVLTQIWASSDAAEEMQSLHVGKLNIPLKHRGEFLGEMCHAAKSWGQIEFEKRDSQRVKTPWILKTGGFLQKALLQIQL